MKVGKRLYCLVKRIDLLSKESFKSLRSVGSINFNEKRIGENWSGSE